MQPVKIQPEDAAMAFGIIEDGLRSALDYSHNLVTYEGIKENVSNGTYGLWIVLNNQKQYVGFFITEVMKEDLGNWVNVAWMYCKPNNSLYEVMYDTIIPLAKEHGMAGVKFISSRPGFERVAEKMGYKKRFVEYVVEDFTEVA